MVNTFGSLVFTPVVKELQQRYGSRRQYERLADSVAGDNDTKIVAGHGPLGNKADLTKFRDMLLTSRDRVERLKSAGKSAEEAVAEKPFADLDSIWGKGIVNAEQWVHIVYLTL
jgi:hypothetical protein